MATPMGTSTDTAMSVASADACGMLRFWIARMNILLPMRTQFVPPSIWGMTYEPIAGMNTMRTAETRPCLIPGRKILRNA